MRVQLINPEPGVEGAPERHARIVPSLGLTVLAGDVIDVPDDVAGVGPHWRAPNDGDVVDLQHVAYLRDTGSLQLNEDGSIRSVYDLGYGLLAQVDVWTRPAEAKATKLQKDGD
jgi:hypothetical protein